MQCVVRAVIFCIVLSKVASRRYGDQQAHRHGAKAINVTGHNELDKLQVEDALGVQYNSYSKHHSGRHVCSRIDKPLKTKQAYCKPVYKNYSVRCQGNQICKGVRLTYETHYKDVAITSTNELVFICCPGWAQSNNRSHGCNKPTCSKPCLNGGKCVKPDLCACLRGFNGPQCEIITSTSKCTKECQNGGTCVKHDTCRCTKGYTGRYCETDINECIEQKPCDQICHNTFGSYYCQCREDFTLQGDGQSCRKESDEGGIEAKDLEYEFLDKRLHKLETMMSKSKENDISRNELENVYKDINHMSNDINSMKSKISEVENYKNDMLLFRSRLSTIEEKAEKVDELLVNYNRLKRCVFSNKICI